MLIHSYTRSMALADGVLVDVTEMAKEAGFIVPVAITRTLHERLSENPETKSAIAKDYKGRLWDVLWMARINASAHKDNDKFIFKVILPHYETTEDENGKSKNTICYYDTLKCVIGGGDNGEPVITIMLKNED